MTEPVDVNAALREVREALEKATPGPWLLHGLSVGADGRGWVAHVPTPNAKGGGGTFDAAENAAFIVAIRNNAEAILSEAERAQERDKDYDSMAGTYAAILAKHTSCGEDLRTRCAELYAKAARADELLGEANALVELHKMERGRILERAKEAEHSLAELRAENERLTAALIRIRNCAKGCHCDRGYPGGCGCGSSIEWMAEEALEPTRQP